MKLSTVLHGSVLCLSAAFMVVASTSADAARARAKKVDANRVFRSQAKKGEFTVIVPTDKHNRSVHLVSAKGKLFSFSLTDVDLGNQTPITGSNGGEDLCSPNDTLSQHWTVAKKCCTYNAQGNCTREVDCKQNVATCMNPDGADTYPSTGVKYECQACDGGAAEPTPPVTQPSTF